MAFDPDAFLLEEEEPLSNKPSLGEFDPDAFLDEEESAAEEPQIDRDYFRPKPLRTEKEKQEIGTFEGITNAAKNAFDSSRQAMDVVGGVSPEEAQNIAKIEFNKKSRKLAPGYDEYQKAEGLDAVFAFAKNPIEVTSNIIAEGLAGSLPALGAGLAAGGVGAAAGSVVPVLGTGAGFLTGQVAGTFAGSLATEYGGKVLEELQGEGMDITDPNSIQTFFGNEELVGKARDKALKRGVPIAAFDAVSAGIGGKLGRVFGTKAITEGEKIIGKQFATKTGEAATELGVQAGLGGGGEIAGSLVAGEPIEGKAVFGEIIGEVGPGSIEVLTGRIADQRAMVKTREEAKIKATSELSTKLEDNNAPLTANVVTAKSATNIEQDKLAAQLEEELTIQETAAAAAQPPTTDATKEIIQPEGVRQEPQDGTQIQQTAETIARNRVFGAEGSQEEGQVARDIVSELQAVSNNTATREQIARLSMDGLVDVRKGQAIINEDGEGILAQAQAPLPTLTPEKRAAEVEATPVTPTPVEPTTGEIPQTSSMIGEQPVEPTISEIPTTSELVGEKQASIKIKDNIQQKIDPQTGDRISVSVKDFTIETPQKGSAYGYISNNVANIVGIKAPKKEGSAIETERGTKTYPQVIQKLSESGVKTLRVAMPSKDSQIALEKLVLNGTLSNPRDFSGPSDASYPTTWDIVSKQPAEPIISEKPATSDIVGAEPTTIVEQEQVVPAEQPFTTTTGDAEIDAKITKTETMSPDEYLRQAWEATDKKLGGSYEEWLSSNKLTDADRAKYSQAMMRGDKFPLPYIDKYGGSQDGRNRALAAKEAGIQAIPVGIIEEPSVDVQIQDLRNEISITKSKIGRSRIQERINKLESTSAPVAETPAVAPTAVSETITPAAEPAGISVGNRIKLGKSPQTYTIEGIIPQTKAEVENEEQFYSVKNERTGEVQVVEARDLKPVKKMPIRKAIADAVPTPDDKLVPAKDIINAVMKMFGKDFVGEYLTLIDDVNEKAKAAYEISSGTIYINRAYLSTDDNIRDYIAHELGHYIAGDPTMAAKFQEFFDSLPAKDKAKLDRFVENVYNDETGEVRLEEKQVYAFIMRLNAGENRSAFQTLMDAIKKWLNKNFKTKFKMTDRDAAAILAGAVERFKSGEFIPREEGFGTRKASGISNMDSEYLAAVERGDMETAQRMVDEKLANIGAFWHGTPSGDLRGGKTGLHVGTKQAAMEALEARIGIPADGKGWNGDKEYSKTLLAGRDRIKANEFGKYRLTGYNVDAPNEDYYPTKMPTVGNNVPIDPTWKPWLRPILIVGEMTNTQRYPISDAAANRKIQRKKGAFYTNEGEDAGSVSAVLPNGDSVRVKLADPVTYDDAGNVIPLSQRFRPATSDIRYAKAVGEPRREQVAGKERGDIITTPDGIIKQTNEVLRNKFFDGSVVSDENTSAAWDYIEQLLDIESGAANALAGQINDVVDQETNSDSRMGASLFSVSLANYSAKLAAQGDNTMISYIIRRINRMPIDNLAGGASDIARALRGRREYDIDGYKTLETEHDSKVERTAAALFGTGKPSEEQVAAVDAAIKASEDTPIGEAEEVSGEVEKVEKRTGRKVVKKIEDQISGNIEEKRKVALEKQKTRPTTPSGVERQAISIIDQFARMQSDTLTFTEKQENFVRSIVQQDLRQRPDMKRKQPWTSQLTAKLIQAGASEAQAETISDLVWRQHEIKAMDRELKELQTAAEKGSLAVIIQRIKDTPLEEQQKPEWMQGVIREYLIEAGLSSQAADTAARLYESVIAERFAEAKQKAFEATLAKSAPWNNYLSRNAQLGKNALKRIQDAIRTGVLDPTQTTEGIIAKENGWSGFSKEQLTRIVQLDGILSDDANNKVDKAEAMSELNKILVKAKMPVRFKDAIGAYYVAQALMGIPTLLVNVVSPIGFSVRNMITDIGKYAFTEPSRIPMAFETFLDSMKSWYNQSSYAFKNQIYMNDVVEYLQGQNVLRELFDKGKDQWAKGDYANGMANMLVGMTQITGRVLSSLDQGAISALENQNITRYAMEAMKQNNIPQNKRKEFANMILHMRRQTYMENVSNGMASDRAGVLADLAVRNGIVTGLSEMGVRDKVLDSAINDALQTVGRNKTIDTDKLTGTTKKLSDEGILSYLPISFLENIASGAAKQGPAMQVFSKMLYGFALVPARVFHTTAWYSPYGFVRLAVDKYKKNKGEDSPYAMSLQTELQYKQRLTEAIAGSVVMLGLAALAGSSTDDDEEKKFRIVITGNGPSYNADKQYYDAWHKKYKPYSFHIVMDDTIIPINIGRGGEALFFPIMLAGALDDWKIKEKLNLAKKEPKELNLAVEALGSAFFALAQRGPYAAFTKPLFDASKDGKITEELVGQAGFFGKTFIPIIGSSLSRNISDFINDPVERSSLQGAIYANTPIVGPWIGTKALNALGQPMRADDWGDKLFKLGVPAVFSFPKNTPENELNELILKKGSGPSIPTRSNAQKRFGDVLTDKEFETYVREYGRVVSDKMFKNRKKLENMSVKNYDDELEGYVRGYSVGDTKITGAADMAVRAVKRSRNE